MGRISSGVGLISGINSKDIIDQLMALEARPKTVLQSRIEGINQQKLAYTDLTTRLTQIKLSATSLKKISTFQAASATSSNDDVLTATASNGAAVGSFQLQVARLVATQQSVSRGFANSDSAKIGAGTITIEQGGGEITAQNALSDLNGGNGVRRGQFRLIDRSGAAAIIDTRNAITLQDVARKINTSLDVQVAATLVGDKLVLTDRTGKTLSDLIVQDLGDGSATDLGLVGSSSTTTLTGTDINYLGRNTSLSQLNDGLGIRLASSGNDLNIQLSSGATIALSLAGKNTVGDVIDAINTAGAGAVQASLVAGSNGIRLTDLSGGGGAFAVTNVGDSKAASDLGLTVAASGATLDGSGVLASFGTVLVSSLNGGAGYTLGTIELQDRAGATANVNLSGAKSVQDILDLINASGTGVRAAVKDSGNGIQITDVSGGTGSLIIGDATGTSATDFGVAGTFDINTIAVKGANLQRKWVSENTLLSDYNGGKGVTPGKFTVTNSAGISATIDLTQGNEVRLGDVIAEINSRGIGVTASINAQGDGLLIVDSAGGTGKLKVVNDVGTTASDLNILGEATTDRIDGSFEGTIAVTALDTLETLQKTINDLNLGVSANILNDGSDLAPFRLSFSARNAGRAGRVTLDTGATTLDVRTLVESQDAAVFVGSADSAQPLLVTSGRNQIAGAIKGVTIDLHGVSDRAETLNITRSVDSVVSEITKFTEGFNGLVDKLKELTKFNTETNTRGLLLGEGAVQQLQTELYTALTTVVEGAGQFRIFADVGIKLGDGAKLEFDEDKFRDKFATDSDAVQRLFTLTKTTVDSATGKDKITNLGLGGVLEDRITRLIDPVSGLLTRQNKTLDDRTTQFQDRISSLDKLIAAKRERLERQFANLESVLANLQSQQQALGQIQTLRIPSRSS